MGDRLRDHAWRVFLVVGCVVAVGYGFIGDKVTRDVLYVALGIVCSAAIVAGVRMHRPEIALPWYLMAFGQLLWVAGDALFVFYENVLGTEPFPSAADAFYLMAYPVLAFSLHLLMRSRRPVRDTAGMIDGATIVVALGLVSWVVLAQPTVETSEDSLIAAIVGAAYPMADILLVAALIRVITSPGAAGSPSLRLLLGALALLIVADVAYLALGLFAEGNTLPIDFLWLASYVLWGAAALHPSMAPLSRPTEAVEFRFRRGRLVAMSLGILTAPATLAVQQVFGWSADVWPASIASVLLSGCVVSRMRLAVMQVTTSHTELERLQRELEFQAAHDPLTGLPNRTQLLRELKSALSRARRHGGLVAVLFIDLDGFKAVNDTHGHAAGDQVLRAVSGRIWRSLRAEDIAARLGGDEFVVVLDALEDPTTALTVANRIIQLVSEPVPIEGGVNTAVGASIGVAFNLDGEMDPAVVMQAADLAVYRAKATGRGRVEVYSELLAEELNEMTSFENAIREAVANDELEVLYQPVIGVRSKRVEGYEALVRWNRPGAGLVNPAQFIPAAEQSDLICTIDNWVMRRALEQVARWNEQRGERDLWVAVNVSGRHVNTSRLGQDVVAAFDGLDVDRRQLVVEITETVDVTAFGVDSLQDLRLMGVGLTLDDLGKGYSSIAQLSRLPVSQVKIDRTYIEDVRTTSERTLLRAMVDAAHALGMTVIGEGVERPDQVKLLESLGVDLAQGYLLGRPMPAPPLAPVA